MGGNIHVLQNQRKQGKKGFRPLPLGFGIRGGNRLVVRRLGGLNPLHLKQKSPQDCGGFSFVAFNSKLTP